APDLAVLVKGNDPDQIMLFAIIDDGECNAIAFAFNKYGQGRIKLAKTHSCSLSNRVMRALFACRVSFRLIFIFDDQPGISHIAIELLGITGSQPLLSV